MYSINALIMDDIKLNPEYICLGELRMTMKSVQLGQSVSWSRFETGIPQIK
jgi:hypothetical protein